MRGFETLLEMSVHRKKAEQIVTGLEQQINLHILKLLAFEADETTKIHWKNELDTWLFRISSLSLKPSNKSIPENLLFKWLYDEPFGGNELQNVEATLQFLSRQYTRNSVSSNVIAIKLKLIHNQLAIKLSNRNNPEAVINKL